MRGDPERRPGRGASVMIVSGLIVLQALALVGLAYGLALIPDVVGWIAHAVRGWLVR
jgi:hypothetical protein